LKHLASPATIALGNTRIFADCQNQERKTLARPLPSSLPEDLAALKNEYMCLIYSYILATFFCRLISNSKRRKLK
jgi:bis(5'-nucleosidyl)-tetraphosphatase